MTVTYHDTKAAAEATGGQVTRITPINGKAWESRTDEDVIADLRPTVTKWQLVQACVDAGITEAQLDAAVALLTNKRQRFWRLADRIDRDNPFASVLRTNLVPVPTPAAWNAIFLAASQLNPLVV